MLTGIFILILLGFVSLQIVNRFKLKYPFLDATLLRRLFYYHTFFLGVYYLYAAFNPSDSRLYYLKVVTDYRGPLWSAFYGTSTTFIEFLSYPFIKYLGFTYEAMMVLFSFFGYLGFIYMYIFFKENVKFRHDFFGFDLLTIFIFLPNLHFWSNSLGKGAIIFLGIGMFFFSISNFKSRWIYTIIGGLIIYHVRPHIMLVVLVSSAIGFVFSTKGVNIVVRILFLAGSAVAFFYIYRDVLTLVGIDESEFFTQGLALSGRATDLTKATSGIDITNYSLLEQIFAFLYRPLFFDAPGLLGLVVSFENVFYMLMTLRLFNWRGLHFLFTGSSLVKSAFLSFITVTIALAQISGNLGLAMRQKSQVMMLLMFAIISFLDERKMEVYQRELRGMQRRKRSGESAKTGTI